MLQKPIFGGISFFVIFVLIMIFSVIYHDSISTFYDSYLCLLIIGIVAFSMGLADDLFQSSPYFKFLIQILCAIVFISCGIVFVVSPISWINYVITIIWVVGIMNSINMLDNMDGITCLVSFSIFSFSFFYELCFSTSLANFELALLLALSVALLVFLFYNSHPSKFYMGDNGSQFIGVMLAYFGIKIFGNFTEIADNDFAINSVQFIVLILAFIIPISDTTTVTINRLIKGVSPFNGDKNHTTHYLFYLGIPIRFIGLIMFFLNLGGVALAFYLIHNFDKFEYNKIYIFLIYPIIVFGFLYANTKISKEKEF
ncbi:MAG: undecaprenyl/decaprenyl-phosphate alpha-N-acetylglucosaminyl 1-phosphate transferase [Bacteroidales bacterium]|nr:undecaprenyl/decaprenyl-phosphate alpha-N-acetylglucosaminyl 1-phosphate transferase [Bacteroidales bacterium]